MVREMNWKKVQLGDILSVRHGKSQHQVVNSNGVYPIFGTGGLMGWADEFLYDKPSVLIGRKGTIDRPQYFDKPFWTIDTLFYTEINNNVCAKYIYYLFNTIDWYSHNEASGVPSLNSKVIEKISILLPSLDEQEVIAKALTDTDNLIQSIEKLIKKKERIKKGTIQDLLTGKKRLDGFSENNTNNKFRKLEIGYIPRDWTCIELNSILSNVRLGGNYTNSEEESSYPLIKMGNLDRSKIKLDKIEYINSKIKPSNLDKLKYGDLLFNTRNTLTLVGKTAIWRSELPLAYYNSNILRLEFKKDYISSSFFMNYILNMQSSIVQLRNFATGTTSVAAIYTRDLMKLKVAIPTNVKEQKAISQILSDMDQEIQGLEEKLEKYKTIKQGMMQELLTGRIRLI